MFRYGDYYYIASIQVEQPSTAERTFLYARTRDFCTWENLGTVLSIGPRGSADESRIWAPHVIEERGVYYMFYTGVNHYYYQSIMLATSTDPSDPESWVKQGVVFVPDHLGMLRRGKVDETDYWLDNRDPMIFRYADNGRFYMYYTGLDHSGGIIGVAEASSLMGPWEDKGSVLTLSPRTVPESPFIIQRGKTFYLYTNDSGVERFGERWRSSPSPFGPWSSPVSELVGWALDFYNTGTTWYATYVIGNGSAIGVTPLLWDTTTDPPSPYIRRLTQVYLPLISSDTDESSPSGNGQHYQRSLPAAPYGLRSTQVFLPLLRFSIDARDANKTGRTSKDSNTSSR